MTYTSFFLRPALAFSGIVDVQSLSRRKIYEVKTNPLLSLDVFNGEAHGLYVFLKEYLDRGDENVWTDAVPGINMIPDDIQDPNTEYNNLSTQYVNISIEKIRALKKTYIDTSTRAAQDCYMM